MFLETHNLKVNQTFSFAPEGPWATVVDTDTIDYEGHALILYRDALGLHGHYRDHTPVWLLAE